MPVVPHKMADGSGVDKENVAQEKADLLVAEWPLSNSPHGDYRWTIDRNRINEARVRSERLPLELST